MAELPKIIDVSGTEGVRLMAVNTGLVRRRRIITLMGQICGFFNVNGGLVCGSTNISDLDTGDTTTAIIYARFPGDNTLDYTVVPGCVMNASWPRQWGDVLTRITALCSLWKSDLRGGDQPQCCANTTTEDLNNHLLGNRSG
ncbi:hypothetical protein BDV12DRAFT_193509 [Aspergillus spectabilis]